MNGFIKDHRKELESDIWSMPPLYHRTWQWLKYNVNHCDNEIPMRDGSHMMVQRGQRLTSVRDIAKGIGWWEGTKWKEPNPKTMSTILEWMTRTGMIIIDRGQGNRQYTLVTLVKYEEYQEKNIQGNSKVTAKKQQADINKNEKNEKDIKHIVDSNECDITFNIFWNAYPKKQGKAKAQDKWKTYFKIGLIDMDTIMNGLAAYMQFISSERERGFDRQYLDGATFVNQKRWNDDWTITEHKKFIVVTDKPKPKNYVPTQEEMELLSIAYRPTSP